MRFFLILVAIALAFTPQAAMAQAAQQPSYKPKVAQVIERGNIKFGLSAAELKHWEGLNSASGPDENGHVSCEGDVSIPVLPTSASKFADKINAAVVAEAEKSRCHADLSMASLVPKYSEIAGDYYSIWFERWQYPRGAGGSCHSSQQTLMFNLKTGKPVKLTDLIAPRQLNALQANVLTYFGNYRGEGNQKISRENIFELASTMSGDWSRIGYYFRNGSLRLDMNQFLLSCAQGSSFRFNVPTEYFAPLTVSRP